MSKEELSEEQIKEAYNEYAKSHERTSWDGWLLVTPMEHSLESFTEICKSNRKYYESFKPKTKMSRIELNINWWAKDDWYFVPTFNLHIEHRCFSFYFLKFTLELAY